MGSNELNCVICLVKKLWLNLVLFYASGCLLALKRLCESLLEMSAYCNNHLILCYFKVFYFCFFDGCPYARHKTPLNITFFFPKSHRTWITCFSIYYPLLSLKWTAAAFNHYALFWFWQLCSATAIIWHCKRFLGVNIET